MEDWKVECGWDNMQPNERIEYLEKNQKFDIDVFDDPPTIELKPEKIDYLRKKWFNKLKRNIGNFFAHRYIESLIKKKQLNIKEIVGLENLKTLNSGAILTCNHFSPLDNFCIQKVFEKVAKKRQKMWKVIREGNYTNPPCMKFFFRNCNTFPLSSNMSTLKKFLSAVKTALNNGDFVLIYPEASLWPDYQKPKPLKDGAFNLAVKNNAPIVPIFITFEKNEQGLTEYTIHISAPIYKDENKSAKENIEEMKNKNYQEWVDIYEKAYNKKLEYLK